MLMNMSTRIAARVPTASDGTTKTSSYAENTIVTTDSSVSAGGSENLIVEAKTTRRTTTKEIDVDQNDETDINVNKEKQQRMLRSLLAALAFEAPVKNLRKAMSNGEHSCSTVSRNTGKKSSNSASIGGSGRGSFSDLSHGSISNASSCGSKTKKNSILRKIKNNYDSSTNNKKQQLDNDKKPPKHPKKTNNNNNDISTSTSSPPKYKRQRRQLLTRKRDQRQRLYKATIDPTIENNDDPQIPATVVGGCMEDCNLFFDATESGDESVNQNAFRFSSTLPKESIVVENLKVEVSLPSSCSEPSTTDDDIEFDSDSSSQNASSDDASCADGAKKKKCVIRSGDSHSTSTHKSMASASTTIYSTNNGGDDDNIEVVENHDQREEEERVPPAMISSGSNSSRRSSSDSIYASSREYEEVEEGDDESDGSDYHLHNSPISPLHHHRHHHRRDHHHRQQHYKEHPEEQENYQQQNQLQQKRTVKKRKSPKASPSAIATKPKISLLPPKPPKELPLRFLRGEQGNVEEGGIRYANALTWRKENNIDTILYESNYDFDLIKKYYPHFYHLRGKNNEPVFYEQPPKTNLKALRENGITLNKLLRHYAFITEFGWQYIERDDLMKSLYVIDLEGIRFHDFVGECVDFVKKASAFTNAHYPERTGKVFVINVPGWFKVIWNVVKPMIPEATLSRIHILKTKEEIFNSLKESIDINNIPKEYGGESIYALGQAPEEKLMSDLIKHNNEKKKCDDEKENNNNNSDAIGNNKCSSCCNGIHGNPPCKFCTFVIARCY